jgi:two-component system, sensor histidine kinase and response regulator
MDGITATQIIRNQLQCKTLPIIAMTANAMKSDRDACLEAGMNEHLGKPFDLEHVIKILRVQAGWSAIETQQNSAANNQLMTSINANEFNFPDAIARMGGNKSLYLKMLPKFLESLEKLPTRLSSLLLAGDIPTATRELHSLKGLSATMGATQFSAEIAQLEKTLKTDPNHPDAVNIIESACEIIESNTERFKTVANNFFLPHQTA